MNCTLYLCLFFQETFVAEPSSEPKHDHLLYDESIPGTSSTKLDTEISNRLVL